MTTTTPSIEDRLRILEAGHGILRTVSEYSRAQAYGELGEEFLGLTEDGVCEPTPRHSGSRPSHFITPIEIRYDVGSTEFAVLGRYNDTLVSSPDGRWRIKQRLIEIEAGQRHNIGARAR